MQAIDETATNDLLAYSCSTRGQQFNNRQGNPKGKETAHLNRAGNGTLGRKSMYLTLILLMSCILLGMLGWVQSKLWNMRVLGQ